MAASKTVNPAGAGWVGAVVKPELFGPYRLEELIGRGGMGEVYRAFDTRRERVVALKRLPAALGTNIEFRARFRREAALAARLTAPHVVPIHDYGEIDGQLFIDMPLVTGTDLDRLLTGHGALDPSRAVGIIAQVASALDAAHAQGLVHRDVKPSNVLLTKDDFAYLADFGVARALDGGTTLTALGATVGTQAYMAPEYIQGRPADHLADIYALACMLFELLTGKPPFGGEGATALTYAHVHRAPPLASGQPGVPAALDDVIARGMAKDPNNRYTTAGQLASAAFAAVHPTNTPPTGGPGETFVPPRRPDPPPGEPGETFVPPRRPDPPPGEPGETFVPPRRPDPPQPPRSQGRRRLLLTTAIAVVVAMAVTTFVLLHGSNQPTTRLVLSKPHVALRDTYFATASGFAPGENLRFSWTGQSNGATDVVPADSKGSKSFGPIFERDPLGNYTITITGITSRRTASAPLQVVTPTGTGTGPAAAQLQLSKDQVALGDTYFITAWGFSPGENLRFSWTGRTRGEMGVFPADSGGSNSHGPIFERHPPGKYTIAVTGLTSGRATSAELQVVTGTDTGNARLMLSAPQVAIGDTYFVTAWGFAPGENLRFSRTGPNEDVIGAFPADSDGSKAISVTENDSRGDYIITVTGSTSGRTASAGLQVVQPGS